MIVAAIIIGINIGIVVGLVRWSKIKKSMVYWGIWDKDHSDYYKSYGTYKVFTKKSSAMRYFSKEMLDQSVYEVREFVR